MDSVQETPEEFYTYEGRLASFATVHKKRASNANSRSTKTIRWPHSHLLPADLARAGWYYSPHVDHTDQVVCFLCRKHLDGWEPGDDPLLEHLRHSSDCGWAILAAVEAEVGNYAIEDPGSLQMVEARKATFAGRWPHESKKGWKCKTKQLVEAGWKYTPTPESDDMATCVHCHLALDGWEPGDKPMDEHYTRSPECPFFALTAERRANPKPSRAKKNTTNKAGRLSVQSVATAVSETSHIDVPAEYEDSIMTTTSVATQSTKSKSKKTAAPRAKKTRTRKAEAPPAVEADTEQDDELATPVLTKAPRGKKRSSAAIEDATGTHSKAPAAKRRAKDTTHEAPAIDNSQLEPAGDSVMDDAPAPGKKAATKAKGRTSNARRTTRKASATVSSAASTASLRSAPDLIPDDDDIDRQLEADLERPLTDDEDISADSDSERRKKSIVRGHNVAFSSQTSHEYAMFDPTPVVPDEDVVDAELDAMAEEMKQDDELAVPKKGRKAGVRKVSKQTTKKKNVAKEAEAESDSKPIAAESTEVQKSNAPEPTVTDHSTDHEMETSSATVVANTMPSGAAKRSRGRPPKKRVSDDVSHDHLTEPAKEEAAGREDAPLPVHEGSSTLVSRREEDQDPPQSGKTADQLMCPPSTPRAHTSPAARANQAVLSPSQSPQSSDAENQPPSSRPTVNSGGKRVVLAPVAATPLRGSPTKRNRVAGLKSATPWTAVDLEQIFANLGDPDKENELANFMRGEGQLTSPEKHMTVEEWIHHNANLAEQRLKHECETLVSKFENEGSKAMRVLEGLVVE